MRVALSKLLGQKLDVRNFTVVCVNHPIRIGRIVAGCDPHVRWDDSERIRYSFTYSAMVLLITAIDIFRRHALL
jgi:hypothetical protein